MSSGRRVRPRLGSRGLASLGVAAVGLASVGVVAASPAQAAAPHVVSVSRTAFTPSRLGIAPGEQVAFRDDAGVPVTLTFGKGWPGPASEQVQPGATTAPRTLTQPGSYGVHAGDLAGVGLVNADASVVVSAPATSQPPPAPAQSPRPAPRPSAHPSARPPARPARTTSPARPAPAPPGPVPTGAAPVVPAPAAVPAAPEQPAAVPPAAVPPVAASIAAPAPASSVPAPPLAQPAVGGGPSASPSPSLTSLRQDRPARRLGLPAAVAVVLVAGLLAGLARAARAFGRPPRG